MPASSDPVALVPVRSGGKTRLAACLSPDERVALTGAMLADVVGALRAAPVQRVVVTAAGGEAVAAAAALGVEVLHDPASDGLDHALRAARARLGPVPGLLVVAADLPLLRPGDVSGVLDVDAPVVIAPTDDGGTGALVRRPADVIATAYGPGSARAHARLADRAGVRRHVARIPGFRHDVDTWSDLVALRGDAAGTATAAFLRTIAPRLDSAG